MGTGIDIVSKLLLDDKDYTNKLNKCKKNTTEFQRDLDKLGNNIKGSVTSAFTSLGAAVGLAGGAVETFKKFINSTNESTDQWEASIRAATTSIDTFFSSIRTGDFTPFLTGLDYVIGKAKLAAGAMDGLQNTIMSYNFFTSKNQAGLADALVTMKDNGVSVADRLSAKTLAKSFVDDQSEIAKELSIRTKDALAKLLTENNRLKAEDVQIIDIEDIMRLDISSWGEDRKGELAKAYKEYRKKVDQTIKQLNRDGKLQMYTDTYGNVDYAKKAIYDKTISEAVAPLNAEYKDAILYNTALVVKSDDWLQNVIQLYTQMEGATRLAAEMERSYNRAADSVEKIADGVKKTVTTTTTTTPGALPGMSGIDGAQFAAAYQSAMNNKNAPKGPQINVDISRLGDMNQDMEEFHDNGQSMTTTIDAMSSAMSSLGSAVDGTAGSWLQWGANVMRAVAQAVPAIMTLTSAESAEATANSAAAVSGGAKSVASIPYVGPALAVAAAASIIAAIAAAPKFAEGGVVGGTSFSGDNVLARVNSGEMVLTKEQQNILSGNISNGLNGKVEFIIRGQQLVGVLNNYSKNTSRSI